MVGCAKPSPTLRDGATFVVAVDDITPVLRGVATALQAHPQDAVLPSLRAPLDQLRKERPKDLLVLEVLARMKDAPARAALREIAADEKTAEGTRLRAIDLLRQVREARVTGARVGEKEVQERRITLATYLHADHLGTARAIILAHGDPVHESECRQRRTRVGRDASVPRSSSSVSSATVSSNCLRGRS